MSLLQQLCDEPEIKALGVTPEDSFNCIRHKVRLVLSPPMLVTVINQVGKHTTVTVTEDSTVEDIWKALRDAPYLGRKINWRYIKRRFDLVCFNIVLQGKLREHGVNNGALISFRAKSVAKHKGYKRRTRAD